MSDSLNELIDAWKQSPEPSLKITSYFPAYDELFRHLRGTECVFMEAGVLDGGSLFMWRKWLGTKARIIGLDLNPAASKWEDYGFEIYIGDQGDPKFWESVFSKSGEIDALLDDGGHQSFQQIVTLTEALKNNRTRPCVIAIEDTVTSFFKDFESHGNYDFLRYAKDSTDLLIGRSGKMCEGRLIRDSLNKKAIDLIKNVYAIQFFNGIVAYKLDPAKSFIPALERNMPPKGASDFRYSGKDSATVLWPHLFQEKTVLVRGGMTEQDGLMAGLKSLIPESVKGMLKRALGGS